MGKKMILVVAALALLLGTAGCGNQGSGIAVQRADQLALAGQAEERYAGMVVSENVVEITRDSSKKVEELYVAVGQEIKAGDKLFSYDSDELELALEKTQLEVEKMNNEQVTYTEQLAKLEKQLSNTWDEATKVRLTLEINTLKTTMMENEYNLKSKDKEIANLQEMLQNIDITSPVDGTIRKVDEEGQTGSYISIQQSGAYRIKGALNEMSMANGLMVGSRVKVFSRVNEDTWMGTVTEILTEDASQNNGEMYYNYGVMDTMTLSSSYVFYVELDSVEGLLLGQHVYMEVFVEAQPMAGLWIPENFITDMVMNEETFETTGMVWAEGSNGKLEQKTVILGGYDYMTGCYEILSGITAEDWLADPANPECEAGTPVSRRQPADFSGNVPETVPQTSAPAPETTGANETEMPEETETVGGTEAPEASSEAPAGTEG